MLKKLGADAVKDRMVIRDCKVGAGFLNSPYLPYIDHMERPACTGSNADSSAEVARRLFSNFLNVADS